MEEMLDRVFGNLQRLEIQPTEHNVEILADCFRTLREIYNMARETEKSIKADSGKTCEINDEAVKEHEGGEE